MPAVSPRSRSRNAKPRAIIFDIDGTLYRSRRYERYISKSIDRVLARMLDADVETAARLLDERQAAGNTVSKSVELLGLDRRDFYRQLARILDVERYVSWNPKVVEMLKRLRAGGLKVVLHTNSGIQLAKKTLKALGISPDCFDLMVTSYEMKPKPSPEGYRHILRMLRLRPRQVIYVGDRFEVEVEPAKKLGM